MTCQVGMLIADCWGIGLNVMGGARHQTMLSLKIDKSVGLQN